jgi:hypothetical protein
MLDSIDPEQHTFLIEQYAKQLRELLLADDKALKLVKLQR